MHDSNDLSGSMRVVSERSEAGYYLIGYTPSETTFQELKRKVRAVSQALGEGERNRVRSVPHGLFRARIRNAKPVYASREEQLMAAALASPFGSGAVRLRLSALFANNEKVGLVRTVKCCTSTGAT